MRIGIGYDSHRLVQGRKLVLGGVEVPFEKGLLGHSDADVLCQEWKDASSLDMLTETIQLMNQSGFEITWIDSVVIAEKPKLRPFIDQMKVNISSSGIPAASINVKAKTNEGMGGVGREEGIIAHAVCLLKPL